MFLEQVEINGSKIPRFKFICQKNGMLNCEEPSDFSEHAQKS